MSGFSCDKYPDHITHSCQRKNYVLTRYSVESEPNKVQLEFGKDVSQCAVLNISRHVRIEDTRLFFVAGQVTRRMPKVQ